MSSKLERIDLFQMLIKNSIIENDHGIISSIILQQQFLKYGEKDGREENMDILMNIACIAIAIHNSRVYNSFQQPICPRINPFAFILGYTDTVQEWGRKKIIKSVRDKGEKHATIIPYLDHLAFDKINWKDSIPKKQNLQTVLHYKLREDGCPPRTSDIKNSIKPALSSFRAQSNYKFSAYYQIFSNKRESFEAKFQSCDECLLSSQSADQKVESPLDPC
jgi:hypothetical protein